MLGRLGEEDFARRPRVLSWLFAQLRNRKGKRSARRARRGTHLEEEDERGAKALKLRTFDQKCLRPSGGDEQFRATDERAGALQKGT